MKLLHSISLLPLMIALTACDDSGKKFPGFTQIEVPGEEVVYLYDPSSVKEGAKATGFLLLKKLKDGYIIQSAETDCKEILFTKDGFFYSYSTDEKKESPGSGKAFKIEGDPHYRMLIKAVCKSPLSESAAEGGFLAKDAKPAGLEIEEVKPVEIKARARQSGFLLKESKAQKSIHQESQGDITIANGSEVFVTGVSSDDAWLEVEYKDVQGKLYIRAENVAVFQ